MENAKKNVRGKQRLLLLVTALVMTCAFVLSGALGFGQIQVEVGNIAMQTYVSPTDAVDTIATEKLRTAAEQSVAPIYRNDRLIEETARDQVADVFLQLDTILENLEEEESFYDAVQEASLSLPVVLTSKQLATYETMVRVNRLAFAEDCLEALQQVYEEGISANELERGRELLMEALLETTWSTELREMAFAVASTALEPNLVLDETKMEEMRAERRDEVSDVLIRENQKIVGEGEVITQEIYDKLELLALVGGNDVTEETYLGRLVLVCVQFLAVGLFVKWQPNGEKLKRNEESVIFCSYALSLLFVWVLRGVVTFAVTPFALFALLVSLLVDRKTAMILNPIFALMASLVYGGSMEVFVYALGSGTFAAIFIEKTDRRSRMIPIALGMSVINVLLLLGLTLLMGQPVTTEHWTILASGAVAGFMVSIIAWGSLPFWESIFEVNTPMRLLEWTNPNNPLLQRLMIEAPGTYHHSLIVANLAESAVHAIGGNATLARVGAYYHDIGKLKCPQYFSENQSGYNPHDYVNPLVSVRIITAHTKTGGELGEEYHLPKALLDIAKEHHGNTVVKYFYYKAIKEHGEAQVNEADYRYHQNIPSSRESAVIMLADTVEAAGRSMLGAGKTLKEVEVAIQALIKDKLDDGQLDHSGLAIHELPMIAQAFNKVFRGMYHERVVYPKKEDVIKESEAHPSEQAEGNEAQNDTSEDRD